MLAGVRALSPLISGGSGVRADSMQRYDEEARAVATATMQVTPTCRSSRSSGRRATCGTQRAAAAGGGWPVTRLDPRYPSNP